MKMKTGDRKASSTRTALKTLLLTGRKKHTPKLGVCEGVHAKNTDLPSSASSSTTKIKILSQTQHDIQNIESGKNPSDALCYDDTPYPNSMIYDYLNTYPKDQIKILLQKIREALAPSGCKYCLN